MTGDWTASDRYAQVEERWMRPEGGLMLGTSRPLRGGRTASEYLRIVQREDSLVYLAQPGGRPPTEFTMAMMEAPSDRFRESRARFPKQSSTG